MIDNYKAIIKKSETDLCIKWRLTNCCNYTCSYCIRKKNWIDINTLKEDERLCYSILDDLVSFINENKKTIKLQLIGGEPTLIDLPYIINYLCSKTNNYIKRISITTNFSKSLNYFYNLIDTCIKNNVELSLTCSFHKEFVKLDYFINKLNDIKCYMEKCSYIKMLIKAEMVKQDDPNLENKFVEYCNKYNISYDLDADYRFKTVDKECSETSSSDVSFITINDVENIEDIYSFRTLLNTIRIEPCGMLCTKDYDFIEIEKNLHRGYNPKLNDEKCRWFIPFSQFKLLDKPKICKSKCNLCGSLSIFKNEDIFKEFYHLRKK